jgi:putative oxidoreductase
MQRLFSTFPDSWPGMGLLILRLAGGFSLLNMEQVLSDLGDTAGMLLRCASFADAVLLWIGLGTPIAATSGAMIQLGIATLDHRCTSLSVVAGALGLALAMLGPGAWSADARIFGRKRIL